MDKNGVSSTVLEERVAMYLQAIEYATADGDNDRRQLLEKDIQTLMDLMEQVSAGQVVTADMIPPPLHLHTHAGEPLANPLGELSSRLADYHKALYYADIEIGENRTQQIQTVQRGLQVIQKLQKKAQAGHPIRAEEIPPPVTIPTEDEFVVDPKLVITERIALYYQAIEVAEQEGNTTRVSTLQTGIQKLEYLLQRADTNIPIYKKDLPCSPALGHKFRLETEQYRTTVELLTKMSGLSARAAKLAGVRGDKDMEKKLQHNAKMLTQVLHDYEVGKPLDMSECPYSLADIERLADQAGVPASQHLQDAETVRLRLNQYKLAALKAKRAGLTDAALKHMRVVKGLQSLLHAVEKGEAIDITQVPPPPPEQTPTTEEQAKVLTESQQDTTADKSSPEQENEMDGISLAEELSAFLDEPCLGEDGSKPHFGSRGFSPESNQPAHLPPQRMQHGRNLQQPTVTNSISSPSSSRSGLNPLYAVTQTVPPNVSNVSPAPVPVSGQGRPAHPNSQPLAPGVIPSRSLKPSSSGCPVEPLVPDRVKQSPVLVPATTITQQPPVPRPSVRGEGRKDQVGELGSKLNSLNVLNSGTYGFSPELTCIEILKFERMQLDKEGSDDAKVAAEKLGRQMDEEKQRLRSGGYEAWLAYLGQVEEDVTNINSDMKIARQNGEDERLSFLIIKKELAERELAVMRKRLPELQSLQC